LPREEAVKIFHEYGVYPAHRLIKLNSVIPETWEGGESGVDSALFDRLDKNLDILETWPLSTGEDDTITIRMSNPGGDAYHMFGCYDRIKHSPCYIIIEVYGHAMSAGGIILQAADKRRIAPNAKFMMHYGSDGFHGHSLDVEGRAKETKDVNKRMEDILLDVMNEKLVKDGKREWSRNQLRRFMTFDRYLDAQKTLEYGLADEIIVPKSLKRNQ
jgi:ATP-dependent Clp protease protease subunit